ncbi:MAG TPA: hypothetical protein VJ184_11995 [Chryseolinea sp.]|nr:hypothetical protein [Chryseolinea sp.]
MREPLLPSLAHGKFFSATQAYRKLTIKSIEETDLYLYGIESNNIDLSFKIINLIQQNKHLHCISLTNDEGKAILNVFQSAGSRYDACYKIKEVNDLANVDCHYIWAKNKLNRNTRFSSESDMETYIIISLKNANNKEFEYVRNLLKKYSANNLIDSQIYNQFIFGNAYPADIVITNESNINVFELKKDHLTLSQIPQIEKEMKKHLCYSLFSNRIRQTDTNRFNFYLVTLRDNNNTPFRPIIEDKYWNLCENISTHRENTITFVEYTVNDSGLSFEAAPQ